MSRLRALLERWRFLPPAELLEPRPRPSGPLVVELVPVYSNGATGALARLELEHGEHLADIAVPPGAVAFRVGVTRRAGIYAGASTVVERPSEPLPAELRGAR